MCVGGGMEREREIEREIDPGEHGCGFYFGVALRYERVWWALTETIIFLTKIEQCKTDAHLR